MQFFKPCDFLLSDDINRVRLKTDGGEDYINASHTRVDVADSICDYIVSQGPLPDTTGDFWDMVWQQDVHVILMLTLDMESMKVKCHRYWPDTTDDPIDICDGYVLFGLCQILGMVMIGCYRRCGMRVFCLQGKK